MRANGILKRKLAKERRKQAKAYLKKKFAQYRFDKKHLLNPPRRRDFDEDTMHEYKEMLARYNKDLLDYVGYKIFLYRKISGKTKKNETYNGYG